MPLEKWEAEIHRKESSPQSGIELHQVMSLTRSPLSHPGRATARLGLRGKETKWWLPSILHLPIMSHTLQKDKPVSWVTWFTLSFMSLFDDRILDWTYMYFKAAADDISNVSKVIIPVFDWNQKMWENVKKLVTSISFRFQQCFLSHKKQISIFGLHLKWFQIEPV